MLFFYRLFLVIVMCFIINFIIARDHKLSTLTFSQTQHLHLSSFWPNHFCCSKIYQIDLKVSFLIFKILLDSFLTFANWKVFNLIMFACLINSNARRRASKMIFNLILIDDNFYLICLETQDSWVASGMRNCQVMKFN